MPPVISPSQTGQTRQSLAADLRALGVRRGQVLLVHSSLRSLGMVRGGASAVLGALRDAVGPEGTLVVPAGTPGNSDTSRLYLARTAGMTAGQIARYKAAMPPFDPLTTRSEGMGAIAEGLRTTPGAVRSAHPQSSFAALGPLAHEVTGDHGLECHLGEHSPLGRLYEMAAQVLLLGVGYEACSAFHLAEYRYATSPPRQTYRCVISRAGQAVWHEYTDVALDDRHLDELGADFDPAGPVLRGRVGRAACRLVPIVAAVDFAVEWLRRHRPNVDL
jgi:aminoglycoside 3-N-acetyltransferase